MATPVSFIASFALGQSGAVELKAVRKVTPSLARITADLQIQSMARQATRNPRRARRGFTIIEVVIVLLLLGIALALAAPRFVRPLARSDASMRQVISSARRTAVDRAQ